MSYIGQLSPPVRASFRVFQDAAPLKRDHGQPVHAVAERFRDFQDAAPLKLRSGSRRACRCGRFRVFQDAAPLKPGEADGLPGGLELVSASSTARPH